MTIYTYAFYRVARQLMTPNEVETARGLAAMADAGDQGARSALELMAEGLIRERLLKAPLNRVSLGPSKVTK